VTASPATTLLRGNVISAVTVRDSSGTGFDYVQTVTTKSPLRVTLNSKAVRTGKHTLIWQVVDRAGNLGFTLNPKKFTFQLRACDRAGNVTYSPKRDLPLGGARTKAT
jgi:hypothetical protein